MSFVVGVFSIDRPLTDEDHQTLEQISDLNLGDVVSEKNSFYHFLLVNNHPTARCAYKRKGSFVLGRLLYSSDQQTPQDFMDRWDTEGEVFLNEVEGNFCAARISLEQHQIEFTSDFFGTMPLFYRIFSGYVYFSSRLEYLHGFNNFSFELYPQSVLDFFVAGHTLLEDTFIKNVKKLMPGEIVRINQKGVVKKNYRKLPSQISLSSSLDQTAEMLFYELKNVLGRMLSQWNIKYAELTGGADTRLLMGLTDPQVRSGITYITDAQDKFDEDFLVASALCKKFGLQHKVHFSSASANYLSENKISAGEVGQENDDDGPPYMPEIKLFGYDWSNELCLQGKYGTEFLGGVAYKIQPYSFESHSVRYRQFARTSLLNFHFGQDLEDPYERILRSLGTLPCVSQELLFVMENILSSYYTDFYTFCDDWLWVMPSYFQSSNYCSPFGSTSFLKKLLFVPREYLNNYRLYHRLYELYFPKLLEIPLVSSMTKYVLDVNKVPERSFVSSIDTARMQEIPRQYLYCHYFKPYFKELAGGLFNEKGLNQLLEEKNKSMTTRLANFLVWYTWHFNRSQKTV